MSEQATSPTETATPAAPKPNGPLVVEMPKVQTGAHGMAELLVQRRKEKQEAVVPSPVDPAVTPPAEPEATADEAPPEPDGADELVVEDEPAPQVAEAAEEAETEDEDEGQDPEPSPDELVDVAGDDGDDADDTIGPFRIDGRDVYLGVDEVHDLVSKSSAAESRFKEAAEERRQAQTLRETAESRRGEIEQRLERLDVALATSDIPEPDWNKVLEEQGSEALQRLQLQWQAHQKTRDDLVKARDDERAKIEAERNAEQVKWVEEQTSAFSDALRRELRKTGKVKGAALDKAMKAEIGRMADYAQEAGFSQEETAGIVDQRLLGVLRKAMKYDALQAEKPRVTKKVREAPPAAAPKLAPESKQTKRQKLRAALVEKVQQAQGKGVHASAKARAELMQFDRQKAS